jgi:ATP-dependent RNA helicase DeaD
VKADVDEEQIAPFMQDISRYFEYIDKDDLIKKIVSLEFGKFLAYYADAPEIEVVSGKESKNKGKKEKGTKDKQPTATSEGYRKLFINLGKKDGFYPGELMQFLNKYVHGHVEVGHIDLLNTIAYFEVPEEDAQRVVKYVNGQRYKGREVRCNDADQGASPHRSHTPRSSHRSHDFQTSPKSSKPAKPQKVYQKDEWMQFLNPKAMNPKGIKQKDKPTKDRTLKGDEPDFSEEGWAIRKPRKKG